MAYRVVQKVSDAAILRKAYPKMRKLGEAIERDVVIEAPKDTGYLASTAYAYTNPVTIVAEVGAYADYAMPVNNGHWTRGHGSFVPANPFLLRALVKNFGVVQ